MPTATELRGDVSPATAFDRRAGYAGRGANRAAASGGFRHVPP